MICAGAGIPALATLAIVLWPGFVVTLTHDTTEVVSTAFILAAILARVRRRVVAYGALAACAMLARETTAPMFVRMLLYDAWAAVRGRDGRFWAIAGALAVLPMVAWHEALRQAWQGARRLRPSQPRTAVRGRPARFGERRHARAAGA